MSHSGDGVVGDGVVGDRDGEFWFLSSEIWLPKGITWESMKSTKTVSYPQKEDLYMYPIPFALVLIVLRILIEKYIIKPFGLILGVKEDKKKSKVFFNEEDEELLEKAYLKNGALKSEELEVLAKRLQIEIRQIERWIRRRLVRDKPTTLDKFSESSWKLLYYLFALSFGLKMLWTKSWFWDLEQCWEGYPLEQVLTNDVWWYYMLGSAYYWAQAFSHFSNIRRKDFWQMFIHHILTVFLLAFSFMTNFVRFGTLVLFLHDIADLFMEAAKLSKYAEYHRLCNFLFGVFSVSWIITRVGVFPFYLIIGSFSGAGRVSALIPFVFLFSLQVVLLILNIFWTGLLLRAIRKAIIEKKIDKDSRSSSDESEPESLENKKQM